MFQALRLEALERHPEAFASSFEEERNRSLDAVAERIPEQPPAIIFGAFAGERLVGMAGFYQQSHLKARHRGNLWGMYVQSGWRGQGVGEALVRAVIEHARGFVEFVELTVVVDNHPAVKLYDRLGFTPYGVQQAALRIGDRDYDEALLALRL